MVPRVFVPDVEPGAGEVVLPAAEAHHVGRVLRLVPGDEVRVFDGRGGEYRAEVSAVARHDMRVRLIERVEGLSMPSVALTLVQAVLKGEAMEDVVRDCTMVGVAAVQPVTSARTTVSAAALEKAAGRWHRVALASARQCGRSTLPVIARPIAFTDWLKTARTGPGLLLVEPAVAAGARKLRDLVQSPVPDAASLVVGPEGGWAPDEREAALAAGCTPLTLGPLTLRARAVPLAATAALLALWYGREPLP